MKGIDTFIETVASYFSDYDQAMRYLQVIRKKYPRYIRDQLQMLVKTIKNLEQTQIDEGLDECIKRDFYSATEFIDIIEYLKRQRQSNSHNKKIKNKDIQPIYPWSESALQTNIQKRDIQEYLSVMEGILVYLVSECLFVKLIRSMDRLVVKKKIQKRDI